jgi:4-hydroxy-tetrahydrodipicolinate synthase
MKYRKQNAKEYARIHMKGIWAAALMPFTPDLAVNDTGFRKNLRHWVDDLGIDGIFVAGKQGEFFSMSIAERKRSFEIAVDEVGDRAGVIASCSDQNLSTVIELAKHAQAIGVPYIVVHAPVLHFLSERNETLLRYYETICEQVDIGIAMWSHEDSGYLMSPELCARIAELPNIVAIKYSVPRASRRKTSSSLKVLARTTWPSRRECPPANVGAYCRVARQYPRARLASLPLLIPTLSLSDQTRSANA